MMEGSPYEKAKPCDSPALKREGTWIPGKAGKTKRPAPRGIPPNLIMGAELRARPCLHHADLLHKVAGLCNNANQLARIANTYGEADQQSIEEMIRLARQIWKEVKNNW